MIDLLAMTAWQKMYFIGMWFGMSWFILEIQKITKEIVSKIPEAKKAIRIEMERQRIERKKVVERWHGRNG